MLGVFGAQERALMMVEPPGEPRVGGVLEVDDGILVAIEKMVVENLRRGVRHTREFKISFRDKTCPA